MVHLFKIAGFLPFLIVMFINASVDLAHKITIQNVLLKSFEGETLVVLTALINGMILLPFIFLFSPSGFLNDKFSKTKVIRYSTLVAIVLSSLILISYINGWFVVSFAMTFLLAVQSAIYSPAKYGLIKKIVGIENLSLANGVIQALTIFAILTSSFAFSIIFESYYDVSFTTPNEILPAMVPIGILLVVLSIFEAIFAFKIPYFKANISEKNRIFCVKKYTSLNYLKENLKIVTSNRDIWLSIIGLSIFWGVSQMVLASFPAHYKMITGDNNSIIVQGILGVSGIGLIIGSIIAGNFSKNHIELGIVPIGALGIFASLIGLTFGESILFMIFSSLSFGFFGGLLIVPLNSIIQYFAKDSEVGNILAGNNFVQNCTMVSFLLLTVFFAKLDLSTTQLFLLTGAITLFAAIFAIKQVPHLFTRILLFPILRLGYRTNVQGIENIPPTGGALLLGNHISWIDWLILQVASPRALKFVMYKGYYDKWYLRWFFNFFDVIPISGGVSRSSLDGIKDRLQKGQVVALFPEGIISYNGQIGKFERGFEIAIDGLDVPIIPFYLRGLWGSTFSRADGHFKELKNEKKEIIISFGKALEPTTKANEVKQAVLGLSYSSWEQYISTQEPLQYLWLKKATKKPFARSIADSTGVELNNLKVLTSVLMFSKALDNILKGQKNIGVLLPSSIGVSVVNLALFALGKIPINLNYTLSPEAMQSAIDQGHIKTVITSDKFLDKLEQKGFNFKEIVEDKAVYAEKIKDSFGKKEQVIMALKALIFPRWLIEFLYFEPVELEDTATILFSSGSESAPKGIELTHKNLLANIKQISDLLNFKKDDVVLKSLPIFHSFGLTVTTLMPLCEGIFSVSVPDPTDVATIGKVCAKYEVSILFGTSTFFRLYIKNKKMQPLMLQNIRIAVSGAEKLREDVKQGFKIKFGLELYEGYGTTETAPVVAVNVPDKLEILTYKTLIFNKPGTIGLTLPGTIIKIVDPQTYEVLGVNEDGLIIIGGPQVMKGYYENIEKTDEAILEIDGIRYYKSGDKGHIDEDGFITIVDRYSRFAKIGGEIISLGSVESQIIPLFNQDIELVATNIEDDKKGEKVILMFVSELSVEDVKIAIKDSTITPIFIPSEIYKVLQLPKLGTGKTDFKATKDLARELSQAQSI